MTVRRISQESGTNRNSFYYHYVDIEDLARTAFRNNAEGARGLMAWLLSAFQAGSGSTPHARCIHCHPHGSSDA